MTNDWNQRRHFLPQDEPYASGAQREGGVDATPNKDFWNIFFLEDFLSAPAV